MKEVFKYTISKLGATLPFSILHPLQMVLNIMILGRWMKENGYTIDHRTLDRFAVFDEVAKQVQNKRVLYLEFGVWKGDSIKYWSNALKHPEAVLHGFDSFVGLPEDWDIDPDCKKGAFNVNGQVPNINDQRVHFFKGWFDEVLPTYELPCNDVLIIVLDADLFSSTKQVLDSLKRFIKPGTYLYFDDLSRPNHDLKAFSQLVQSGDVKLRLVSADYSLSKAFFVCE